MFLTRDISFRYGRESGQPSPSRRDGSIRSKDLEIWPRPECFRHPGKPAMRHCPRILPATRCLQRILRRAPLGKGRGRPCGQGRNDHPALQPEPRPCRIGEGCGGEEDEAWKGFQYNLIQRVPYQRHHPQRADHDFHGFRGNGPPQDFLTACQPNNSLRTGSERMLMVDSVWNSR